MVTLEEAKLFLRVDEDAEDNLIASLIAAAESLTEDVLRRPLADYEDLPETIRQAILIIVATLYEERQSSKGKEGVGVTDVLDLVRRMLFAYRREAF